MAHQGLAAEQQVLAALAARPNAPLAAQLWLELAQAYEEAGRLDDALSAAANVLVHPAHAPAQVDRALALGEQLRASGSPLARARWLVAAAGAAPRQAREYLAAAATWLDAAAWETLWADAMLPRKPLLELARIMGRRFALAGNRDELARLAEALQALAPTSEARSDLERWLAVAQRKVRLGMLVAGVPEDEGKAYVLGATSGLAQLSTEWEMQVEHAFAPTEVSAQLARLAAIKPQAVLVYAAPAHAAAVVRAWHAPLPLLMASPVRGLARGRRFVFLDAPAPWTEATSLAQVARRMGATRMLVLGVDASPYREEAQAFAEAFTQAGGEVVELDLVAPEEKDIRALLIGVRARTDNEALLYKLDEDMELFAPSRKLAPRLPPDFDGVYLAMPGKLVFLVAPQLAWAGIRRVVLLGSTSWDDGHLLDDRGRYLTGAVFCSFAFWRHLPEHAKRAVILARQMGHTDAEIVGALASRLALEGADLAGEIAELRMWNAPTGILSMNLDHEMRRALPCHKVRGGRIIPLAPADAPTAEGSPPGMYSPPGPRGRSAETPPPPRP